MILDSRREYILAWFSEESAGDLYSSSGTKKLMRDNKREWRYEFTFDGFTQRQIKCLFSQLKIVDMSKEGSENFINNITR